MFKGDDDEDPENTVGATKYPCMPSLVALQQMRNRLNLAYLGKKLMKWTAVATGKELRRLALQMAVTYESFKDNVRDAFILLARCRYFYPNMNKMVLENAPQHAAITLSTHTKQVTGVKVVHLDIKDNGEDPYMHLGIAKGGQTITAAKEAWRSLLKRVILMLDQRISFQQVEIVHMNATKKRAVLEKTVIPRIKVTIVYILSELEENEREENFRLKRFKQLKNKHTEEHEKWNNKIIDENIVSKCIESECIENECIENEYIQSENIENENIDHETIEIKSIDIDNETSAKITEAQMAIPALTMNVVPSKSDVSAIKEEERKVDLMQERLEPSFERFIDICDLAGQKPEKFEYGPAICDICGETAQRIHGEVKSCKCKSHVSIAPTVKSAELPSSDLCTSPKLNTDSVFELGPDTVDKLGYFEKKFKEIVKVTRIQNEDGSISEEKQVITIHSERRNPGKIAVDFAKRPIGSTGGYGGSGYGKDGKKDCGCEQSFSSGNDSEDGKDFGGDRKSCYCNRKPRETKSEPLKSCKQISETKFRSCISASNPTITPCVGNSSVLDNESCTCSDTSRSLSSFRKSCSTTRNVSSRDLPTCSAKKSASICNCILQSGKSSQISVPSHKNMMSNSPSQTCCDDTLAKKPIVETRTCCLRVCGSEIICRVCREAACRDVWTSTTDLIIMPSKAPSKIPSRERCVSKSSENVYKQNVTKYPVHELSRVCTCVSEASEDVNKRSANINSRHEPSQVCTCMSEASEDVNKRSANINSRHEPSQVCTCMSEASEDVNKRSANINSRHEPSQVCTCMSEASEDVNKRSANINSRHEPSQVCTCMSEASEDVNKRSANINSRHEPSQVCTCMSEASEDVNKRNANINSRHEPSQVCTCMSEASEDVNKRSANINSRHEPSQVCTCMSEASEDVNKRNANINSRHEPSQVCTCMSEASEDVNKRNANINSRHEPSQVCTCMSEASEDVTKRTSNKNPGCEHSQECTSINEVSEDVKKQNLNKMLNSVLNQVCTCPSKDTEDVKKQTTDKRSSLELSKLCTCVNNTSEEMNKRNVKKSDSNCTIKLIAKPSKPCNCKIKQDNESKEEMQEIVLSGSIIDALKRIFKVSTESCKSNATHLKQSDTKTTCEICAPKSSYKITSESPSFAPALSRDSSYYFLMCKMCQAKIKPCESEVGSYGLHGEVVPSTLLCQSIPVVATPSNLKSQCTCKSTPSLENDKSPQNKHPHCVSASKRTESVCPSKEESSDFQKATKSTPSCTYIGIEKKDASTCTRRSNKYDVRPIKRCKSNSAPKLNLCNCISDPRLNRSHNYRPYQSRSFNEENFYFKW